MPPTLALICNEPWKYQQVTVTAAITTGGWLPSHTGCVLLPQSVLQNTQTYFLLLHLHFLFSPFTIHTVVIPGSGAAEGLMWFKASPDKMLGCQGAEQSLSRSPGGPEAWAPGQLWQCSCVNSSSLLGRQPWRRPHWTPFPTPGLHSSSELGPCQSSAGLSAPGHLPYRPWLCPDDLNSGVTLDLPITTELSGGHQAFGWPWLTSWTCSTLVWLPHQQDHCPACFVVMLSFQPAFFYQVIPLVLRDKWNRIASH